MSDEQELTQEVGQDVVADANEAEGQVKDQTAEDQTDGEKPEQESEDEKRRKESAKERRERDKAYKQRLRDEATNSRRHAEEAERRRDAIIRAGQQGQAPARDQFSDPAEYAAARAVWQYQRSAAENMAGEANTTAERARQQAEQFETAERHIAQQQWTEQVVEARMKYADFDQVALASDVPITPEIADIIRGSDAAADLAYYLGKNKAEAGRIAQLPPIAAARELGRIEASLTAPKPRTETKAPPPITPGKASGSGGKSPDKMSAEEYRVWRESGGKF